MIIPLSDNDLHTRREDIAYMQQALQWAAQGLGRVAPNPSVGCVIVNDGRIVGQARSADGGRPHAETQALAQAGALAQGATVYATLEPCGHFGKTPPCVEALIKAGIARVVIACRDPFQKNNGCLEKLAQAGIEVTLGVCEAQAQALNEGFFTVLAQNRPLVTAKVATSLDGRIATHSGLSKWITGEQARGRVHELRAAHDAVLAGIGTVLADDPQLNVRLPGHDYQPVRIIIDPALKIPPDSRLVQEAAEKLWILHGRDAQGDRQSALADCGAKLLPLEREEGGLFMPKVLLAVLAGQGITRLFVEGGGRTLTHLLRAGTVDRLFWFRAPKLIGGDGVPVFQALGVETMADAPLLRLEAQETLGEDLLEIWRLRG